MLRKRTVPLGCEGEALLCTEWRQRIASGKLGLQSPVLAVLAADCSCVLPTGSTTRRIWRLRHHSFDPKLLNKVVIAADFSPSNLQAQLKREWPAWTKNACRSLSQVASCECSVRLT